MGMCQALDILPNHEHKRVVECTNIASFAARVAELELQVERLTKYLSKKD